MIEEGGPQGMDASQGSARPALSVVMFVVPEYSWTWDSAPTMQDTVNIEVMPAWRT